MAWGIRKLRTINHTQILTLLLRAHGRNVCKELEGPSDWMLTMTFEWLRVPYYEKDMKQNYNYIRFNIIEIILTFGSIWWWWWLTRMFRWLCYPVHQQLQLKLKIAIYRGRDRPWQHGWWRNIVPCTNSINRWFSSA